MNDGGFPIAASPISVALEIAHELGLEANATELISSSSRDVVLLKPCQALVKVAPTSELPRFNTEMQISTHVQSRRGPVVPPLFRADPGPHIRGRWVVSLWEYVPSEVDLDALELASVPAYAELRTHLDDFRGALPYFTEPIMRCLEAASAGGPRNLPSTTAQLIRGELATIERVDIPADDLRVLHGDPHARNLTRSSGETLWLDLKSACLGPLEWDLTALPLVGHFQSSNSDLLARLRRIRSACVVVSCSAKPTPSAAERDAIDFHLEHLGRTAGV